MPPRPTVFARTVGHPPRNIIVISHWERIVLTAAEATAVAHEILALTGG